MSTKLWILCGVVAAILIAIVLKNYGMTFGRGTLGFQNSPPGENTFTMYYADWCPHCQEAKPGFKELADKGYVGEGRARCKIRMIGLEENPEGVKSARMPVKGFPSFHLETPSGEVYEYQGSRTTDGYLKFINEKLGGGI
jgi:thiol-disulfide isomerase/thioredoxin